MNYTPIIGIEIHVELKTKSKMFCGCPADHFGKEPNTQTCPVCLGLPGALPVPNKKAVEWTIMIGHALSCTINKHSKFDRKHYFYPDLPKGYQISQYDEPLCEGGQIETSKGTVTIERAHLEEDTGKLKHRTLKGQSVSLVDFNRSSVPLVEIVSHADVKDAEHAREYAQKIAQIVRFLDVSDADMEKGSMRLEANISLKKPSEEGFPPYKVEVKNINSFRYLKQAIDYEIERQAAILDQGEIPKQETRGWNESKNATVSQRSKETAKDYRYFPEPDIPPMEFTGQYIQSIKDTMPSLPEEAQATMRKTYNLREDYITILTSTPQLAKLTLQTLKEATDTTLKPKAIATYIVNNKPENTAKEIIDHLRKMNNKPQANTTDMQAWVSAAIKNNPELVQKYKSGKTSVIGAFVGDVMHQSKGQADPKVVTQLLKQALDQV